MLTVNEPYPAHDDCPYHGPGHHSPECKICQEIDGTALKPRTITIPDSVRERHAQDVMSRPARYSYSDALTELDHLHYGPVSARGLLAMADLRGYATDGEVTVKLHETGNGYYVMAG